MKGRLELTDSISQYNAIVSQLHKNVSTLKVQLKRQEETIKKLREPSIRKVKTYCSTYTKDR